MSGGAVEHARRLAGYIKCPERVQHLTMRDWGRTPSIAAIREMQASAQRPIRSNLWVRESDVNDGVDFVVAPAPGIKRRKAEDEPKPKPPAIKLVGPREIIAFIAAHYNIPADEMSGVSRHQVHTRPRHLAAYVLVKRGSSLTRVGGWLKRDHTSIKHAVAKFSRTATDAERQLAQRLVRGEAV